MSVRMKTVKVLFLTGPLTDVSALQSVLAQLLGLFEEDIIATRSRTGNCVEIGLPAESSEYLVEAKKDNDPAIFDLTAQFGEIEVKMQNDGPPTRSSLILAVKGGDADAWRRLVEVYGPLRVSHADRRSD